ncbi:MOSC domain-containing protein [Psychromonas sp. CNPT3]|uniref:MOSC domain-containing protein n=1 Tax=Psychromonas sp. CNPT3 TaxID=314282 RepID=UPI00006E428E|nr:MOSC domain-containing protein [Psychromonas sp. CNPT3]AGH80892.1 MOSC domain-containing protein [Psychromonas sp. CNPT3]
MKIISTNISKVKTIIHNGKEIRTGIFKEPTSEEVVIGQLNIKGDEQADLIHHGGEHKAVYAFCSSHYAYWQKVLGIDNLSSGIFGENFTISNLSEAHLNIGDQLRIGTALLEVSQPRVPCFKLAIALDNKNILKLFTQNYCTGVYFRVLEAGVAKTGDSVVIEKKSTHGISIKTLFQAYFDSKFVDSKHIFTKALALKELAPEWKEKLKKRLA